MRIRTFWQALLRACRGERYIPPLKLVSSYERTALESNKDDVMDQIRCQNCGAIFNAPPQLSIVQINQGFHCSRCQAQAFQPHIPGPPPASGEAVAGATVGALLGAAMGGPPGAIVGGLLGFIVGSKR